MQLNKIHEGDSLLLLKEIPDESIDLLATDPPYKIKTGGARIEIEGGEENKYKKTDPKVCLSRPLKVVCKDDLKSKWLKKNPDSDNIGLVSSGNLFKHNTIKFQDWLPDVYRVLKNGTHAYMMINGQNINKLWSEAEKAGFIFQNIITWDKGNLTPNKYYMQGAEFVLMFRKGKAKNINDMGMSNIWRIKNIIGNKLHPTQKPIELMQRMVEQSSNVGDLVLDPFMGAGSTALACINAQRNYIGMELDSDYIKICEYRINTEVNQLKVL